MKKILLPFLSVIFLAACGGDTGSQSTETVTVPSNEPPALSYTVTNIYPHDATSFTEGLEWYNNNLYESTGLNNKSKLAKVDLKTGKDLQKVTFPEFGEGITILNGKLYQLTYTEKKCFVYDVNTFKKIKEFTYDGEGWGMTNNGKQLIMNNGGHSLYFRNPETFAVEKTVQVTDNNGPVDSINEMELVGGVIYANIWQTNYIIKINPESGKVLARADFSGMKEKFFPELAGSTDVLNGIAYDSTAKRFFITGKLWPKLFEVKF